MSRSRWIIGSRKNTKCGENEEEDKGQKSKLNEKQDQTGTNKSKSDKSVMKRRAETYKTDGKKVSFKHNRRDRYVKNKKRIRRIIKERRKENERERNMGGERERERERERRLNERDTDKIKSHET